MAKKKQMQKKENPPCPKCGNMMKTLLFLGVEPEFYVCDICHIAYDMEMLKPMAQIF